MKRSLERREFLGALGAFGAAALTGETLLTAAETVENVGVPKKVASLADGTKPTLTIAHCCDPQLGFGIAENAEAAYRQDLQRLEQEIELLNAARPDVAVFAGDMTHLVADAPRDWPRLLKKIEVPFLIAPGNHDVPDPVKKAALEAYCAIFGDDNKLLNINGWKIVAANSQFCRSTDETALRDEHNAWFEAELRDAASTKTPVIVATHVPPFVKSLDEKDEYFNFPTAERRAYLDFCVDNGVKF
ncbi:MAG: metallophosphoesterase, partial [Thermoguttaceae bacterium]|nr:metallophosphoesterase [Thermoguttaceae bacterium]